MRRVLEIIRKFVSDESGLELIEYAIIGGIITVAAMGTIAVIGVWLGNKFVAMEKTLKSGDS